MSNYTLDSASEISDYNRHRSAFAPLCRGILGSGSRNRLPATMPIVSEKSWHGVFALARCGRIAQLIVARAINSFRMRSAETLFRGNAGGFRRIYPLLRGTG